MILYHGTPKTVEVPRYGFGFKENEIVTLQRAKIY